MKRKSTLDRIEFDTETYEILSRASADRDQTDSQAANRLEPGPMLGLQALAADRRQATCPPYGAVGRLWKHEESDQAATDWNHGWMH